MSLYFLPLGSLVPGRTSPDGSEIMPMVSMTAKSVLVKCLAVLPLMPLLRGWSLYVGQTETLKQPNYSRTMDADAWRYKGTGSALLNLKRNGANFGQFFRGTLPLLATVSVSTIVHIPTLLAISMVQPNNKDNWMYLGALLGIHGFGEVLIQPLRYTFFVQAAQVPDFSPANYLREANFSVLQRSLATYGLRGPYAGFLPALVASQLSFVPPLLIFCSGNDTAKQLVVPASIGCVLAAYPLYALSFRMAIASSRGKEFAYPSLRSAAATYLKSGPRVYLAGYLTMVLLEFFVPFSDSSWATMVSQLDF